MNGENASICHIIQTQLKTIELGIFLFPKRQCEHLSSVTERTPHHFLTIGKVLFDELLDKNR